MKGKTLADILKKRIRNFKKKEKNKRKKKTQRRRSYEAKPRKIGKEKEDG